MDAIQDKMPGNNCFGCGPDNAAGMRIKSYWQGDESICQYQPTPEQCAGPPQFVYGGTIASLIDCHCIGTATSNHYLKEGRDTGEPPEIWCVTGRLTVNYLAPTPINQQIELRAQIVESDEKKTLVECAVYSGGIKTAVGEVIAIRVADDWKNG